MKSAPKELLLLAALAMSTLGLAENSRTEQRDPRVIHAPLAQRQEWVIEQAKGPGAWLFDREYVWILGAESIGPKEARQLANLFFYSTGVMGGYFGDHVKEGTRFRFAFHSELGPVEGYPVFVDAKTGLAWQEGQNEKTNMLSLIRLFTKNRKEDEKVPTAPEHQE